MSNERDGFEAWVAKVMPNEPAAVKLVAQCAWIACAMRKDDYCQPLLEAKDEEIFKQKVLVNFHSAAEGIALAENTTLKALLEQAREGLEKAREPLHQAFNRIHCLPRGTDTALASRIDNAFDTVNRALTAINAATGEK